MQTHMHSPQTALLVSYGDPLVRAPVSRLCQLLSTTIYKKASSRAVSNAKRLERSVCGVVLKHGLDSGPSVPSWLQKDGCNAWMWVTAWTRIDVRRKTSCLLEQPSGLPSLVPIQYIWQPRRSCAVSDSKPVKLRAQPDGPCQREQSVRFVRVNPRDRRQSPQRLSAACV